MDIVDFTPAKTGTGCCPYRVPDGSALEKTCFPRLSANAARFAKLKTQKDEVCKQLSARLQKKTNKVALSERIVYS